MAGDNIINHQIKKCIDNKFKKIFINILKKNFKYSKLKKKKFLSNIIFFIEKKPLGTAGGVGAMSKKLYNEENILIIYGDNLSECNYSKMLKYHKKNKSDFTIGYYLKKNPHYSGVLTTKKNIVFYFQEKITKKDNKKNKLNSGIYILKAV